MSDKQTYDLPPRKEDGRMPKPDQTTVDRMVEDEEEERGYTICGGWRPVKGGVCCRRPLKGRERCKDCGGRSPRGRAHPNSTHLLYSRDLPKNLRRSFEEISNIEALKEIGPDLRLTHVRISQLIAGLDDAGTTKLWRQLNKQARKFRDSDPNSDAGKKQRRNALTAIFDIIERGATDSDRWEEVVKYQSHRQKLIETDKKIHQDNDGLYTAEQVNLMIAVFKQLVYRNANDELGQRISNDIDETLLGRSAGRA